MPGSPSQSLNIDGTSNRLLGFNQTVTTRSGNRTLATVNTPVSYTVDANGSMTSDGLRTFEYDASNRLAKVSVFKDGEAASVSYLHNALGQRVFKGEYVAEQKHPDAQTLGIGLIDWLKRNFGWMFVKASANTSIGTAFIYGGDNEIPTYALLAEYDNGSAIGNGRSEYVYLPTDDGNALLMGVLKGNQLHPVHTDHLGTPRLMTNDMRTVVWQRPYSAFGTTQPTGPLKASADPALTVGGKPVLTRTNPPVELNVRESSQYEDVETGLSYNLLRSFASGVGRFTQMDPIGLAGGLNRPGYVGANPLNLIDPLGLAVKCKTIAKIPFLAEVQECTEDGSVPSEQDARDAKRMSDRELEKACRANGYKDAHAMKDDLGLNSKSDIFSDKNGNMYSGPRQGTGTPNYLHMNTRGIIPK